MMKWMVVAAVVFVAGAVPVCARAEVSSLEGRSPEPAEGMELSQCGVNSLYLCLKYHGIEQRLDELYAQVPADDDGNVSLKQLADYARSKGLHVKAVIKPTAEDVTKALKWHGRPGHEKQEASSKKQEEHGRDARATEGDTSVILQYAMDMGQSKDATGDGRATSVFRHIVAIVSVKGAKGEKGVKDDTGEPFDQLMVRPPVPQEKIFVLDYPGRAREIAPEKLAELVAMSEGMLVLSTKPLINAAEFLNFRSVKSWSFYAIFAGLVMLAGSGVSSLRGRRKA